MNILIIEGFVVDRIATVNGPLPEIQEVTTEQYSHLEAPLTGIPSASTFPKISREVESLLGVVVGTAVERAIRVEDGADRKIEAAVGKRLEAIGAIGTATV